MNFGFDPIASLLAACIYVPPCLAVYRRMKQGVGQERVSIALLFVSYLLLYFATFIYGFIHYWRIGEL